MGGEKHVVRILFALLIVLAFAATAQANPIVSNPSEIAAYIVVVLAALFLEVLITAGFLLFSGIAVVPMGIALFLGNTVSYAGIVLPVFAVAQSVWLVEVLVVLAETALIKLLSLFELFQQDTFYSLKWRHALLAALAGNACSYYVGTLLSASSVA